MSRICTEKWPKCDTFSTTMQRVWREVGCSQSQPIANPNRQHPDGDSVHMRPTRRASKGREFKRFLAHLSRTYGCRRRLRRTRQLGASKQLALFPSFPLPATSSSSVASASVRPPALDLTARFSPARVHFLVLSFVEARIAKWARYKTAALLRGDRSRPVKRIGKLGKHNCT